LPENDAIGPSTSLGTARTFRGERDNRLKGTTVPEQSQPDPLLTPAEVAALFRVNPKTVTRWARAGKITAIRTLGGHRRFRASEIRRSLEEMQHHGL
jgi:excisionase family DNA binding protein